MKGSTPTTKLCVCGKNIPGTDTHSACSACLGLQHAQAALATPVTCKHCARLSNKTCRRRLARLVSLSTTDPIFAVPNPSPQESETECPGGDTIPEGTSWRDQLDAVTPMSVHDVPLPPAGMLAVEEDIVDVVEDLDSGDESISLGSDSDNSDMDDSFGPWSAAKPPPREEASGGFPNPPTSTDLHDVCRRAAANLGVEWPETPAKTSTS